MGQLLAKLSFKSTNCCLVSFTFVLQKDSKLQQESIFEPLKKIPLQLRLSSPFPLIIGKKVEVSLRLFDIFERNGVFIFLLGNLGSQPGDWSLDGTIKLFFCPRKNGIGEKFTFYVYFEMKKSSRLISQFPIPRSTFSAPPFRGCEALPKHRPNF